MDPQSFYHYSLAHEFEQAGRLDDAVAEYKKAAELDPTSAIILRDLAMVYLKKGNVAEARAAYRKAVEIDPRDVVSLYNLARLAQRAGELKEADEYFRKGLAAAEALPAHPGAPGRVGASGPPEPVCGMTLYQYALMMEKQGRNLEAADMFVRLVKWLKDAPQEAKRDNEIAQVKALEPKLVEKAAQLYFNEKQPEKAVRFIREVVPDMLGRPDFGPSVVLSLLNEGQKDLARELALEIQKLRPRDAAAYQLLMRVLEVAVDSESLLKTFREFARQYPEVAAIKLLLGQKLVVLAQDEEGVKFLKEALARPEVAELAGVQTLASWLVDVLLERKKNDLALEVAKAALARWPEAPSSYDLLDRVCRRTGDAEGHIAALRKLQKDLPGVERIPLELGKRLIDAGRVEEGVKVLQPLADGTSEFATVAKELLLAHYAKLEKPEQALKMFAEALARKDKDEDGSVAGVVEQVQGFIDKLKDKAAALEAARPLLKALNQGRQVTVWPDYVLGLTAEQVDPAAAAESYKAALETDPQFAQGYRRRAAMLFGQGRFAEALETLRQAIDNGVASSGVFHQLGTAYELIDRDSDAIAAYGMAARLFDADEDDAARENLIRTLIRAGQTDKARQFVDNAIAANPADDETYCELAYLDDYLNDQAGALAALDRGLAIVPESIRLLYFKTALLRQAGRFDEALAVADKLAAVEPPMPEQRQRLQALLARLRMNIYISKKDYAKAEAVIQERLAKQPDDDESLLLAAALCHERGQTAKAEEMMAQVLAHSPRDAEANNDLGFFWADRGEKLAESERMIRWAVGEEPDSAAYLDSLGWVLYKQNKLEEAVGYLQRSVHLNPRLDPVVWEHLGDARARLGRTEEASVAYEKAKAVLGEPQRQRDRQDEAVAKRLAEKLQAIAKGRPVPSAPLGPGVK